jgi:DNA-binding response OmpR family regulator
VKVLIVDDDPASRRYTSLALEEAGIGYQAVDCATDARAVLKKQNGDSFDVMLLDVELPGTKGWELLSELRSEGIFIPVIFVSIRESLEDRVQGLNLGADDYIVKPFEFAELVARVRAVLRRSYRGEPLRIADLIVDPHGRRIERNGHPIELTPREFDVFWMIAQAGGRLVSQKELLARVWGIDFDPETKQVEVHVHRLRKKLESGGRVLIDNVYGEGYRLRT